MQSGHHWRKTRGGEGEEIRASRHRELSRIRRSRRNRVLLRALRRFVDETGMGHSEIANELGISAGEIMGWMYGTVELRTATLDAIRDFLRRSGPEYLLATQLGDQEEREQITWHSFVEYPQRP
jgi:transcriptional regulator with XRE-family HTH domain